MIDKTMSANDPITSGIYNTQAVDIINAGDQEIDIEMPAEEGMVVEIDLALPERHDDNLLETVFAKGDARKKLESAVEELVGMYEEDLRSRDKWEKTYREGLKLLGLQMEERTDPWEGACGVFHPLLTEAVVRFQSETIVETFPATGPVKTKVMGKQTPERLASAERVKDDMNWRLTEEMSEYRVEHERMLWSLPIAGSAFKKVYYDADLGRQTSLFVPAEDIVVNYGTTDIQSADRVTHVMRRSEHWLDKMIEAGVYVADDLGDPTSVINETQQEKDRIIGIDGVGSEQYEVLEMMVNMTIEPTADGEDEQGIAWPYVVTINKTNSNQILGVRRNWREEDMRKRKRNHFVHYSYITGFGFYGFGLIHLVGGHAQAGTSMLRQLIDAGTLSNLPGGFKTRGLRIKNEDQPIKPGEFRDADVTSGTLKDNIVPLPYKEPSATLVTLLQSIVEDGRKAAAISDASFSDANQNAPVGTTLALIERQLKTLSAVQARVHAAMHMEFKLIKELVKNNGEREYPYEADPDRMTKTEDYDCTDIIPVSDPNATTMGVRIAQYQAVLQMAEKSPQLYDQAFLHREMLVTIGVKNAAKIVPLPEDLKPRDPISENMAILMNKPVRAFVHQDHASHIAAHQGFLTDAKVAMLMGQNPNAQMMTSAMNNHIAEHGAYQYRDQVQKALGVELPDPNGEMDPQTEYSLAGLLAQAAAQVQAQNQNEQAQQVAQQQAQDPLIILQQKEMEIKGREATVKEGKLQLERDIAAGEGKLTPPGMQGPQVPSPVDQARAMAVQQQAQTASAQASQSMGTQNAQAQAQEARAQQAHDLMMQTKVQAASKAELRAAEAHRVNMALRVRQAAQNTSKPGTKK